MKVITKEIQYMVYNKNDPYPEIDFTDVNTVGSRSQYPDKRKICSSMDQVRKILDDFNNNSSDQSMELYYYQIKLVELEGIK